MACVTLKRSYEFDPVFGFPQESFAKRIKLSDDKIDTYHNLRMASKSCQRSSLREISVSQKNHFYKNSKLHHERIMARREAYESSFSLKDNPCKKSKFNFEEPKAASMTPQKPSKTRISIPTEGPLLSTSAAGYVCNMVVGEHEKKLREHYERVLNSKLASQLEGYVRHNLEILRNRYFSSSFSYAS